ncbi:MAG: acyclic terpene utilization AtuA family protein, partial [Planctomycetota bacterium]
MRFARIAALPDRAVAGLADDVAESDLELLQLDYARTPCESGFPEFAPTFAEQLQAFRKALFLNPELRVVTNAGWANALFCVEEAAKAFAASGCGEIPFSAVRGSNLLPILDFLVQAGVDLANSETGAPWSELKSPMLAADLELGGGPFGLALAEGARVIVAGCYDVAAPLCGAAVQLMDWNWSDHHKLSGAVAAAHAAAWPSWRRMVNDFPRVLGISHTIALLPTGEVALRSPTPLKSDAAAAVEAWIRACGATRESACRSDVVCRPECPVCVPVNERQLRIAGAKGEANDHRWRLNIIYQRGFAVEMVVGYDAPHDELRAPEALDRLRRLL